MFNYFKLISLSLVTALLCACGGGGGGTAAAPTVETSSSQLAASVKLTGYAGLSLAQTKVANGTQTASLGKLLDWVTDAVFPKAYAQATVQCNYDLLKLAGVASDGTLEKLPVTTGADDCTTGFIDMYDGAKYILLTASGIYKDGLTCNLVLINKGDGNLYCVGERSRSIYKISGADSWKAYEKLQVSDDGNYMFLETDSTVFDQNGQVTGIKTKLLRFDLTDDKKGPVASTLVEGFQQAWLNNTFGYNTESEGFSIKGYQGLNNGDVAILYQRYISTSGTWAQKLNAFYYTFAADGSYDRVKFDDTSINSALTNAYTQATVGNGQSWTSMPAQQKWYDISCFFKDSADNNSFVFTIPYWYGYYDTTSTQWKSGLQSVIFKGSKPAAGAATMPVSTIRGDSSICAQYSSTGIGATPTMNGSGSRPSKVGETYYALQSWDGWDGIRWSQKTYLIANKFDGAADVKQVISTSNTWTGSRKIYATKDYLFLKSPADGMAWTSTSQPGDNLWRIDPAATLHALVGSELNPLDYKVVIDASEFISIAKLATSATDNAAKLTGRDLADPDLTKIIGDIDAAGLFTKATAVNTTLQPVSIVKL
ncbi:hypothetical protein B9Z36_12555 [Limnohabitans sp. Rim8]|uniref:hypothetical protein n=1 Tax=Limnohabitans sp. Rim8 TaxID=1100718 RepID=UPI000D38D590|nr:hypothetical protein [Limnohabitans sp. Rim8]PUE54829.1 hypothetical protein B9Z36_12555 [Limnohabitans sp. Rim8]